jgi:hypothetical protein
MQPCFFMHASTNSLMDSDEVASPRITVMSASGLSARIKDLDVSAASREVAAKQPGSLACKQGSYCDSVATSVANAADSCNENHSVREVVHFAEDWRGLNVRHVDGWG